MLHATICVSKPERRLKNIRNCQGQCHFYLVVYTLYNMRKLHVLRITIIFSQESELCKNLRPNKNFYNLNNVILIKFYVLKVQNVQINEIFQLIQYLGNSKYIVNRCKFNEPKN